jgi:hypothetical protein
MSEKPLSVEALQGDDSASEISQVLPYGRQEARAAVDPEISDDQVSQKHVTHLSDAPDGGLRAWLVVFARVHFQSIEQSLTSSGCSAALVMFST